MIGVIKSPHPWLGFLQKTSPGFQSYISFRFPAFRECIADLVSSAFENTRVNVSALECLTRAAASKRGKLEQLFAGVKDAVLRAPTQALHPLAPAVLKGG